MPNGPIHIPDASSPIWLDPNNRPMFTHLEAEIIDQLPDAYLPQVIIDNLITNASTELEKSYEIVFTWNQSRQTVFLVWILDGDVNNGGFHQFNFNSRSALNGYLPAALTAIGAHKYAKLTAEANKFFETQFKLLNGETLITEEFTPFNEDIDMEAYDTQYYDLSKDENIMELLTAFIRNNKADFTGDPQ